jgi:hypothetical protein
VAPHRDHVEVRADARPRRRVVDVDAEHLDERGEDGAAPLGGHRTGDDPVPVRRQAAAKCVDDVRFRGHVIAHGSTTTTPASAKSATLRVASAAPWLRQIAAI